MPPLTGLLPSSPAGPRPSSESAKPPDIDMPQPSLSSGKLPEAPDWHACDPETGEHAMWTNTQEESDVPSEWLGLGHDADPQRSEGVSCSVPLKESAEAHEEPLESIKGSLEWGGNADSAPSIPQ